jgi:hypothetical protein
MCPTPCMGRQVVRQATPGHVNKQAGRLRDTWAERHSGRHKRHSQASRHPAPTPSILTHIFTHIQPRPLVTYLLLQLLGTSAITRNCLKLPAEASQLAGQSPSLIFPHLHTEEYSMNADSCWSAAVSGALNTCQRAPAAAPAAAPAREAAAAF